MKIFGGSVDFAKLPYDLIYGLATGNADVLSNIARGRLSPPVAAALSVVSNTNPAKGNAPILGNDKYGNPQSTSTQLGNLAQIAAGAVLPQQAQAGIGAATGSSSPEQAIATATELPVSYQSSKTKRVSTGGSVRKPRKASAKTRKPRSTRVTGKVRVKRARLKRTVTKA